MDDIAPSLPGGRQREALTVTVGEALRLVGIGRTRFYELIAQGQVTTVKIGRRRLIHFASLERLVSGEPPPAPGRMPSIQLPLFVQEGERVEEERKKVERRRRS